MERFIFFTPTGASRNFFPQQWAVSELERAVEHWRRHFRGDAIVKRDSEVSEKDIASTNLVLWGDTSSNLLLGRIAGDLPIKWDTEKILLGKKTYSSADHAVIMVYPNRLNPKRYVV